MRWTHSAIRHMGFLRAGILFTPAPLALEHGRGSSTNEWVMNEWTNEWAHMCSQRSHHRRNTVSTWLLSALRYASAACLESKLFGGWVGVYIHFVSSVLIGMRHIIASVHTGVKSITRSCMTLKLFNRKGKFLPLRNTINIANIY